MDSQANTVIHQETVETRMRKTRSSIISEWIPITSKNSDIQQGITIPVYKTILGHICLHFSIISCFSHQSLKVNRFTNTFIQFDLSYRL